MKKGYLRTMVLGVAAIIVSAAILLCAGCNPGSGPGLTDNPTGTFTSDLQFDITGAKAVAGNSSTARTILSRALGRTASSLASLVRINEDGTIASAISFGANNGSNWTPDVSFISVGDDGSVYICFSNIYQSWAQDGSNTGTYVQFVRVYPDNSCDLLWPLDPATFNWSTTGQVNVWSWWGMDSDPLQKGDDGKLYFKVTVNTSGVPRDFIYSYDPVTREKPVLRTPANGSLYIESFKVDSQKHLFIKSASNGPGSANYLRCYSDGVTAPANIYYSSDQSGMWVRGYTSSPDGNSVILNGYQINGMSGIIRANILSSSTISYDLLYSNAVNASWISLSQWDTQGWTNPVAIVYYNSSNNTWTWSTSVLTAGVLDKAKLLSVISPYYIGDVTIADENFTALKDADLNQALSYSWITSGGMWPLGSAVSNYGESFLKFYFGGTLYKDWLAANNLQSLDLGYVGAMLWGGDGSLYGLYDSAWWSGSSTGTKVLKLLDGSGARSLAVVNLQHGNAKPTKIKFIDGYLYYRYAVMNGAMESGYHKLARYNLATAAEEEILTDAVLTSKNLEILSYDVSSDSSTMYISALDYDTNAVIFGKIDLATKVFTQIQADTAYSTVRTF